MLNFLQEKSGMPIRYRQYTYLYFREKARKSDVSQNSYLAGMTPYLVDIKDRVERGQGLYYYSRTAGSGKTSSACVLMNQYFFEKCLSCSLKPLGLFINVPSFLQEVKNSWDNNETIKQQIHETEEMIKKLPFVILDDIGTEMGTSWSKPYLYNLINERYNSKLFTIYTSNKTYEELKKSLGDRIVSRIADMSQKVKMPEVAFRTAR